MNKVVYVPWRLKPRGYYHKYEVPTGETKKGFLGKEKQVTEVVSEWVHKGYKDEHVSFEEFMRDIQKKVSKLNKNGYEIISVVPITKGEKKVIPATRAGYGYGYTAGMTIFARKVSKG